MTCDWITDQYSRGKPLPARKYSLGPWTGPAGSPSSDSDGSATEEEEEEEEEDITTTEEDIEGGEASEDSVGDYLPPHGSSSTSRIPPRHAGQRAAAQAAKRQLQDLSDESDGGDEPVVKRQKRVLKSKGVESDFVAGFSDLVDTSSSAAGSSASTSQAPNMVISPDDLALAAKDVQGMESQCPSGETMTSFLTTLFDDTITKMSQGPAIPSASDFLRSWAFDCKVPRGLRQALRAANVVDKLQYWKEAYLQCVADTSTLSAGPLSGCLVHIHKSVSKEETKMLLQIVSELGGELTMRIGKDTTHVISEEFLDLDPPLDSQVLQVSSTWLTCCKKRKKKVDTDPFLLD